MPATLEASDPSAPCVPCRPFGNCFLTLSAKSGTQRIRPRDFEQPPCSKSCGAESRAETSARVDLGFEMIQSWPEQSHSDASRFRPPFYEARFRARAASLAFHFMRLWAMQARVSTTPQRASPRRWSRPNPCCLMWPLAGSTVWRLKRWSLSPNSFIRVSRAGRRWWATPTQTNRPFPLVQRALRSQPVQSPRL